MKQRFFMSAATAALLFAGNVYAEKGLIIISPGPLLPPVPKPMCIEKKGKCEEITGFSVIFPWPESIIFMPDDMKKEENRVFS